MKEIYLIQIFNANLKRERGFFLQPSQPFLNANYFISVFQ